MTAFARQLGDTAVVKTEAHDHWIVELVQPAATGAGIRAGDQLSHSEDGCLREKRVAAMEHEDVVHPAADGCETGVVVHIIGWIRTRQSGTASEPVGATAHCCPVAKKPPQEERDEP